MDGATTEQGVFSYQILKRVPSAPEIWVCTYGGTIHRHASFPPFRLFVFVATDRVSTQGGTFPGPWNRKRPGNASLLLGGRPGTLSPVPRQGFALHPPGSYLNFPLQRRATGAQPAFLYAPRLFFVWLRIPA